MISHEQLADGVTDARQRTCELVADLSDEQLIGPRLDIVNPFLWEIGHVAWFQEKWVLRHACGQKPIRSDADALYDSTAIPHDRRWELPLPSRVETLRYLSAVRDRVLDRIAGRELTKEEEYFIQLSIFHEDMHTEAFTYTRQTLGYAAPSIAGMPSTLSRKRREDESGADVQIPGGPYRLGADPDEAFVFDNEKWSHSISVRPYRIARTVVTQSEFAAFVDGGGYRDARFWSDDGWRWRQETKAEHPVYWQRQAGKWLRRHFDQWVALELNLPVIHVNWYEAEAYCRWAGRRLPTEVEWEMAAAGVPEHNIKRRFPWSDLPPSPMNANLDWRAMGCVDVDAHPEGDSAFGCRQMIGNVWEWTASAFLPYPGFEIDPYKEYSAPWFGTHKVLRGGCWATRSRLIRNTWRNFYRPERRDVWAGFRTCAP